MILRSKRAEPVRTPRRLPRLNSVRDFLGTRPSLSVHSLQMLQRPSAQGLIKSVTYTCAVAALSPYKATVGGSIPSAPTITINYLLNPICLRPVTVVRRCAAYRARAVSGTQRGRVCAVQPHIAVRLVVSPSANLSSSLHRIDPVLLFDLDT